MPSYDLAKDLKEILRCLPMSVSVITCSSAKGIFSTTISSLFCVDIQQERPVVGFQLRSESQVGMLIKEVQQFTLSVLSIHQKEIAIKYSQERDHTQFPISGLEYEQNGENYYSIKQARFIFHLTLESVNSDFGTHIYFSRVQNLQAVSAEPVLLYESRKYGFFEEF
jgi:flavin reductase (DIM6/NTAB) family NADH-FMN oxidoreductase RutF